MGFPGSSDSKASAYNAGDPGSIPGLGRSAQEGKGNPLQYSCLENPMDWVAWWATVHGVAKSWAQLSGFTSGPKLFDEIMELSKKDFDYMNIYFPKQNWQIFQDITSSFYCVAICLNTENLSNL